MKITEQSSKYTDIDRMPLRDILININNEDKSVAYCVEKCIPHIERLVDAIVERMKRGGRLFYIGAGTSGRLGIVDASEIPPTYGAPYDLVIGLIAGGDVAIRKSVEMAEDNIKSGWEDMQAWHIGIDDVVVGIAASGTTPYVIGAVREARYRGVLTACITCNPDTPISMEVDIPIEAVVGPEFVTGSTRMKAGTAQKLILNMISTATMIRMGHVKGNSMVDMQLSNTKLLDRGALMVMEEASIADYEVAKELLIANGSVRKAVDHYKNLLHD